MNGFITINEKDWEKATSIQKDWMTYNTLQSIDRRLTVLEKRKIYNKAASFLGGIIGGFGAFGALVWTKIKLPF